MILWEVYIWKEKGKQDLTWFLPPIIQHSPRAPPPPRRRWNIASSIMTNAKIIIIMIIILLLYSSGIRRNHYITPQDAPTFKNTNTHLKNNKNIYIYFSVKNIVLAHAYVRYVRGYIHNTLKAIVSLLALALLIAMHSSR